jgi:hypothetical protein
MQIGGLVLDIYDDFGGSLLKEIFPTFDAVPSFVKQAEALDAPLRERLPDNVFALVLHNGDQQLRKYACTDPGNTTLSVLYFLKNASKLPEEAQKTAAENLEIACSWYGLEELAKEAGLVDWAAKKAVGHAASNPLGTAMALTQGKAMAQGAHQEIGGRMNAIRQFEGSGGGVATPEQIGHMMGKHAEMSGTPLMPLQALANKNPPASSVATVKKVGSIMRPHVDVTDQQVPVQVVQKTAERTALGDRYPLDTYEQVKRAAAYFSEYGARFSPEDRREFCRNMVPRAEELGINPGPLAVHYGASTYAPMERIKQAMVSRKELLSDELSIGVLDAMEEKIATTDPELFCHTLKEFDLALGLNKYYDRGILDPYFSTFGTEKTAEAKDTWAWLDGNTYLTLADLKTVVRTRVPSLAQTFGQDFVLEMRKDPIGIFESLPKDQKRMIAAMALDNNPGSDLNP